MDYISTTHRTPQAGKSITAQALLPLSPKRGSYLCKTITTLYRLQQRSATDQQGTDGQTPADYDWIKLLIAFYSDVVVYEIQKESSFSEILQVAEAKIEYQRTSKKQAK